MSNFDLYNIISTECSKNVTKKYSTSFSSAIFLLHKDLHQPIYNIYGFVRLADEIVDTFHHYNKQHLFQEFKTQTFDAMEQGISLNPILQSFQLTVAKYNIDKSLIDAFLYSMELDLSKESYTRAEYEQYIFGSAEAVGLMCLQVFCDGNKQTYKKLEPAARKLGAAFQKVNFLRDIKADNESLGRMYFPSCDFNNFTAKDKIAIEADILKDFNEALSGIKQLPIKSRLGVYVAYQYYYSLFKKIRSLPSKEVLETRIRIPDFLKAFIVARAGLRMKLNLL